MQLFTSSEHVMLPFLSSCSWYSASHVMVACWSRKGFRSFPNRSGGINLISERATPPRHARVTISFRSLGQARADLRESLVFDVPQRLDPCLWQEWTGAFISIIKHLKGPYSLFNWPPNLYISIHVYKESRSSSWPMSSERNQFL